ncbi:MAG TPA: glycosyltransferase [Vicinamibacterales bacterium]|nr:glycosyltransferase [Vicinamibacterales bacterium]
MDSALEALDRKGNLQHALTLYNPLGVAERVVHFTPHTADRRYAALFEAHRIDVVPYLSAPANARIRIASMLPWTLWSVIRKIRAARIDVIRGRLPYFGSLLGCLAGRILGVPSVVSLGGDNRLPQRLEGRYYFGSKLLSYGIEHLVLLLCNVIVVPNEFTRRYVATVIGERRAAAKTELIPWAVSAAPEVAPAEAQAALVEAGFRHEVPLVLIVGHLNRYKFATEMFEVAVQVTRRRRGQVQFAFCGDGPLRAAGEQRLAGVEGARILGWQSNDVVRRLMAAAAVVVVPMSGFVLLEAASAGKPVITSNLEWHSELVTDGITGWLIEPTDVAGWSVRIEDALDRRDVAAAIGRRLGQRFREHYRSDVVLAREADLYTRLAAGRSAT